MSLQLLRIVLFLPFFFIGSTGNQQASRSPPYFVIQRPLFLNASESSDVTLNCKVEGNVSSKWFVNWIKVGKKEKLKNSNRIFVIKNETDKSSTLTLKSAVVNDSGIYHCEVGHLKVLEKGRTNVTIWEKPNVTVDQVPQHTNKKAGANVSITCRFNRVDNCNLIQVTWYKDNQEFPSPQHCEKQKVFLKLQNVDVKDSGNYPSQPANIDGGGRQSGPPSQTTESGIGIPVGVGVAVGTLVFLLLLGVLVWRSKRKNKVAKEAPKNTLTKRMSDVTYADIRFHKREAQPDTEVVYAEVRSGTKRPEHRDRGTQPAGLH
ncbi:hypothetical protein E2320_001028 [Naja naja]|nr:hypothetical protein E2320_001028 [Naja naja]